MSVPKNAVVLAAGKSKRFFPPLYDSPKGLFVFRDDVLIERQIEQLISAGVKNIDIVIGYEKERFFYLADKYPVNLIVSRDYADEGSLPSLMLVPQRLGGTIVCYSDHWYADNPFLSIDEVDDSFRLVRECDNASREFVVDVDEKSMITSFTTGKNGHGICMVGYAYLSDELMFTMRRLYQQEKDLLGTKQMFWEQFWWKHSNVIPLRAVYADSLCSPISPIEFDGFSELGAYSEFELMKNMNSDTIANICATLDCGMQDIRNIEPIGAGLTNSSFTFIVDDVKYVYRHPSTYNQCLVITLDGTLKHGDVLIDRYSESVGQDIANKIGIDNTLVKMDSNTGWKISRYVEPIRQFGEKRADFSIGARQLARLHNFAINDSHVRKIDMFASSITLLKLAETIKPNLLDRYETIIEAVTKCDKRRAELSDGRLVFCHNDAYSCNWLCTTYGVKLIDWEYAGYNDPMCDLGSVVAREEMTENEAFDFLFDYLGHNPSECEKEYAINAWVISAWYWFCWSVYKDSRNEDGFFMLPAWRSLQKFLVLANQLSIPKRGVDHE